MLSNSKVLKLLKKHRPAVRWVRQKDHDIKETVDGEEITKAFCFAGVKGREGIRFGVSPNEPTDLIKAKAEQIARRLIRGEQ